MSDALSLADKFELLSAALEADDADEFARLMALYPECRWTEGSDETNDDPWLSSAAADGRLWAVKWLVSQGASLHKPSNSTDSVPAPEGPLPNACESGNLELVQYMLDQGVPINYTIDGRTRCHAITSAATRGHLEIVKLLVERGADFNAVSGPWTALDYAISYGHSAVADYLRPIGGKTGDELKSSTK